MPTIRKAPGSTPGASGSAPRPGVTRVHVKGKVYEQWATPKTRQLRQKRVR